MKKIILTMALLLLCGTSLLHAGPQLLVPEKTHHFGSVPEGVPVSHRFILKNTGDAELRILRVNPG